jgi:hypothetical protein
MHQALRAVANGGVTSIDAAGLVPMTETERAFVALPATVRSSEVPSQPHTSEPHPARGPSDPAVVLTPPNADVEAISAHAATLSSADTVDAALSGRRDESTAPPQAPVGGSSSLELPVDPPRVSRAPLVVVAAAILGLAILGIAWACTFFAR